MGSSFPATVKSSLSKVLQENPRQFCPRTRPWHGAVYRPAQDVPLRYRKGKLCHSSFASTDSCEQSEDDNVNGNYIQHRRATVTVSLINSSRPTAGYGNVGINSAWNKNCRQPFLAPMVFSKLLGLVTCEGWGLGQSATQRTL